MSKLAAETITITPDSAVLVDFDFDADIEQATESITAVTSVTSTPTGIVSLSATAKSAFIAQVLVTGSAAGSCTVKCRITASNSQTFEGAGTVTVAVLG